MYTYLRFLRSLVLWLLLLSLKTERPTKMKNVKPPATSQHQAANKPSFTAFPRAYKIRYDMFHRYYMLHCGTKCEWSVTFTFRCFLVLAGVSFFVFRFSAFFAIFIFHLSLVSGRVTSVELFVGTACLESSQ